MKIFGLLFALFLSACTQMESNPVASIFYKNETVGTKNNGSLLLFVADWSSDKEAGSESFRFPALFKWDGLAGYANSKEVSTLDLFLYSHEITHEEGSAKKTIRRDIFPFITWDSGEKESGFSFLVGLFAKHERNGKTGGKIFFISWGE